MRPNNNISQNIKPKNYLFNINYISFNKIYSQEIGEIEKFKKLNLKTSVSDM